MALDFNAQRDVLMAFTTPLAQVRVREAAEINPGLKRAILEREAAAPSQSRSNVGGWHSRDDLLSWGGEEIAVLDQSIREAAGQMMALLAHPRRCELEQELAACNPFGRTIAIPPETGRMVVFPSWLYHWVNPYQGTGERISIAFNSRVTKYRVLDAGSGGAAA
jgi:hypothetical protein